MTPTRQGASFQSDRERVWILEMNSSPLKVEKKDEGGKKLYRYRGPCAEFSDEMNENNRIYDEKNYDNKAGDLQEKISKNALCGELDHNEDFLVSMKNASHKITELKKVKGGYEIEIELIPGTDQGDNAIALAEAGVPLFISSRASGYIDRNGNVTLEKIYTYDLVSEPGFKNAELVPVNESKGQYMNKADGLPVDVRKFKNSEVRIFRFNDSKDKGKGKGSNTTKIQEINTQNKGDMGKEVSRAEFLALKKEIDTLKRIGLQRVNESLQIPSKLKYNGIPVEMLAKVPLVGDVITVDAMDFKVNGVQNIDESKENSPEFKLRGTYAYTLNLAGADGVDKVGYLTKTGEFHVSDKGISTTAIREASDAALPATIRRVLEAIGDKVNELVDSLNAHKIEQKVVGEYLDGISKMVNVIISGHDKQVKFANMLADHQDASTHVINSLLESSESVAERVNLITESLDATQQLVNEHVQYTDAQTKILNTVVAHAEKATKHLNMLHKHSDELTTTVNVHESKIKNGKVGVTATPARKLGTTTRISQSINESKTATVGKGTPAKKVDVVSATKALINKVNSNKTEESRSILEQRYPFIKQFTEEEVSEFRKLSPIKRQIVIGKTGVNARKANILEAVRSVAKTKNGLEFLDLMSVEKRAQWEELPLNRKQNIISLFQSKNLRSNAAIEEFWDNINMTPTPGLQRRAITESVEKVNSELIKSAMGYQESDMDAALGL